MGPLALVGGSFLAMKFIFSGRRKYKSKQAQIEVRFVRLAAGQHVGRSVDWSVGRWTDRSVGRLVGRALDWSVCRLVGRCWSMFQLYST